MRPSSLSSNTNESLNSANADLATRCRRALSEDITQIRVFHSSHSNARYALAHTGERLPTRDRSRSVPRNLLRLSTPLPRLQLSQSCCLEFLLTTAADRQLCPPQFAVAVLACH